LRLTTFSSKEKEFFPLSLRRDILFFPPLLEERVGVR
jgi:hypothetical protein